jgi:tetratricopeptide (TPR) repeat protein
MKLILFLIMLSSILVKAQTVKIRPMAISKDFWKSEEFRKEFNGTYRINGNIEPSLSGDERAELLKMENLMAEGKRKDVIRLLKASKFLKLSAGIQFNLANVLSEEGELDEAIGYYQLAISSLPSFRRAHQNIAYTYSKKGELARAYDHLIDVVRLGGNDGGVMGLLGFCYQNMEQYESALLAYRNAQLTQPKVVDWKLGIAYCLQRLGKLGEAIMVYEELERIEPEQVEVKLQLVNLYIADQRPGNAIIKLELLNRLGQLDSENQLLLGTLYLGNSNPKLGANQIRDVFKSGKLTEWSSALNAIRYSIDLQERALAGELLQLVKEESLEGKQKHIYRRLKAQHLMLDDKNLPQCQELLESLVTADPLDTHSLFLLGKVNVRAGKSDLALLRFEQVVKIHGPQELPSLLEMAKIYVQKELYGEAVTILTTYLKIDADPKIQEYLDALNSLIEANS